MKVDPSSWQEEYRDPMLRPPLAAVYLMVVIERGEARIFSIVMKDGRPWRVMHYDPSGNRSQLRFRLGPPMGKSHITLHGGLVDALHSAGAIVVVGQGPGAAGVVEDLLVELQEGHPDLSQRVYAAIPFITGRPTEARLLELARTVFAADHPGRKGTRSDASVFTGDHHGNRS